jgi:hypothetical protein
MKTAMRKIMTVSLIVVVAVGAAIGGWYLYRTFVSRAAVAKTATLSIEPATGTFNPGDTITANVKLATGGAEIATVGAEISYDKDILKLTDLSTKDSILKMWMPTPDYEEMQNGKINLLGSTNTMSGRKPYQGENGQIITMEFKVKTGASGTTKLEFNKDNSGVWLAEEIEGVVYNVLGTVKNAEYTIGSGGGEVPATPTGLTAKGGWYNIVLNWNASAGASGYKLYYGTTSGKYTETVDVGNETSFVAKDEEHIQYATVYYFAVTAYNAYGTSSKSKEASAKAIIPGDLAGEFTPNHKPDKKVDTYDYDTWVTYWADYTERGVVDNTNRDGDMGGGEVPLGQKPFKSDNKIDLSDFETWLVYWIDFTQGNEPK